MLHTDRLGRLSRRALLKIGGYGVGAVAWLPRRAAAAPPQAVPRNRTLTLVWSGREGRWVDHELWNPYAIGANHQSGSGLLYEPLAYYSAFADQESLWLATGYAYNADLTELTIHTRTGIQWSDGVPFSADDVAYTLNTLRDLGPKVRWGVDVQQFMQEARVPAPDTVVLSFRVPAPRFFYFMTYKYDIGVYIVPRHIFQEQDWTTFKHFDTAKDWPVTTSPWKVAFASPEQKILDRRATWWAATAGLAPLPRVERQIWLPTAGEQQLAQALITNQVDYSMSILPSTMPTVLRQNPKIITHSGHKPPYGYMDWWPHALYVNHDKPPFDAKDVRWALSAFIDRQQIVEVSWAGASEPTPLPMPSYPALRPYIEAVQDLLGRYPTQEFRPQKGAELLRNQGWKKDKAGFWVNAQEQRLTLEIIGIGGLGAAVGPVITEQLKRQGIEASFRLPPDFDTRFQQGHYTGALYGHGGSVNDPYHTLRLYQSASLAVPGAHLVNFTRWKNAAYDAIVDEVFRTDMRDKARLLDLFRQAMAIWLPELPDIPLTHNFHRIPMNTTYWQNWPTEEHPYVNGAFWHLTFAMILWHLQPTQ